MTESALWKELSLVMKGHADMTRHEDIMSKGVPDSSFSTLTISGWIELKTQFSFQKGLLKIPTLTPFQRTWLQKRHNFGGHCFVLGSNEKMWFLVRNNFINLHKGISTGFRWWDFPFSHSNVGYALMEFALRGI